MKIKGIVGLIAIAVFFVSVMTVSVSVAEATDGNIVENGGFEKPLVGTVQKWDIFSSGTQDLGWTVEWCDGSTSYGGRTRPETALLELHRGVNNWIPYEGNQYAELDTDWDGPGGSLNYEPASVRIYQDLTTVPDGTYELSFAFSPRPGVADNKLEVVWDGAVIDVLSADGTGLSNTKWTCYTYTVIATSGTARLEFADLSKPDSLGTFLDDVSVILQFVTVDIDIKPGSYPNSICLNDHGLLPVAILGSAAFNVYTIDASTIEIGGVSLASRGSAKAPKLACSYEDVNDDGYVDLIAFFDVQELITQGVLDEYTVALTLTAYLPDGTPIEGMDSVRVVPP